MQACNNNQKSVPVANVVLLYVTSINKIACADDHDILITSELGVLRSNPAG